MTGTTIVLIPLALGAAASTVLLFMNYRVKLAIQRRLGVLEEKLNKDMEEMNAALTVEKLDEVRIEAPKMENFVEFGEEQEMGPHVHAMAIEIPFVPTVCASCGVEHKCLPVGNDSEMLCRDCYNLVDDDGDNIANYLAGVVMGAVEKTIESEQEGTPRGNARLN